MKTRKARQARETRLTEANWFQLYIRWEISVFIPLNSYIMAEHFTVNYSNLQFPALVQVQVVCERLHTGLFSHGAIFRKKARNFVELSRVLRTSIAEIFLELNSVTRFRILGEGCQEV